MFPLLTILAFTAAAGMAQPPAPAVPQQPPSGAFEQLLAYVYQQDPQLVSERQALQMDDEHVSQAFAGFRPSVTANGDAGRQRESIQGQDWLYGPDAGGSVVAQQPLFNGFGTLAQFRAAKARVRAGRAKLIVTEQRALFTAIGVWLDLCEKQKILAFNTDNVGRMYKYLDATRTRFKAGDGTRTDVDQSESRMAEAEAGYARAQAEWEIAQAAYMRLTGMRPPLAYLPPLPKLLPQRLEDAEEAARENPEIMQADEEVAASEDDVDTAKSSLWPTLSLRGEASEARSPELGLARLRDDSVTLNLSIPLYAGGAEYSRVREANIAHERTREADVDTVRSAIERARQSWYNYVAAASVIASTHRASEAASRALSGVQEEQSQGMRTTLDVLNAQSELLNVRTAEVQAEKNMRLEAYRLMAAMGRLTAPGLQLPTALYDPKAHYEETATRSIGF